jgi:hypothetical protein
MTISELNSMLREKRRTSRNARFPRRYAIYPDPTIIEHCTGRLCLAEKPRSRPRRVHRGDSKHDIWIWSPSGHQVEARFDIRDDAEAARVLAAYDPIKRGESRK